MQTRWMKLLQTAALAALVAAAHAGPAQAVTTVTVSSFPSFDEAVKLAIPRYKKLHPEVEIKLVSLSFNDHHNAMTTALATNSGIPDVMGLEVQYIGKFAESRGLEDLNAAPYNGRTLASNLHKFGVAMGQDLAGSQIALPADVGPGTLFYRKDILDKAGVSEAQLTKSWDSYIETGKIVRQKTGAYLVAHASELYSTYIRSNLKDGEGLYFDKAGNSLVNSPRFKRAFELALAARRADIEAKIATWSNEWREGFKREQVATQMSGAWLVFHLESWLNPEGKGKWRAVQMPEGAYTAYGGAFYSIPKKAVNKKEAWDFIQFLIADKEVQQGVFRKVGSYPALRAAMDDQAFIQEPLAFLGGQKARVLWKEATARIPMVAADRYDQVAAEIVGAALDDVLEDGVDITKALADADDKLKRRVRRR